MLLAVGVGMHRPIGPFVFYFNEGTLRSGSLDNSKILASGKHLRASCSTQNFVLGLEPIVVSIIHYGALVKFVSLEPRARCSCPNLVFARPATLLWVHSCVVDTSRGLAKLQKLFYLGPGLALGLNA